MTRRSRRRPNRRRIRLGTRLLTSVMLPVVVLGGLGGFDVIQRHREVASASDVQARVARVKQALQLYLGLVSEHAASEFIAVAATFGMTPTQARQCWGSTAGRLPRSALDAALAVPGSPLEDRLARLSALPARVDRGVAAVAEVRSFFHDGISMALQARLAQVAALSRRTVDTAGSAAVRRATNDFGTGYSSLSYLQRLPIDTLKVDKSFIDLLGGQDSDASIVTAVINLGRALGTNNVAEGVELAEQMRQLQRLGCHQAQGYYFARPVTAAAFAAMPVESPRLVELLPPEPATIGSTTFRALRVKTVSVAGQSWSATPET